MRPTLAHATTVAVAGFASLLLTGLIAASIVGHLFTLATNAAEKTKHSSASFTLHAQDQEYVMSVKLRPRDTKHPIFVRLKDSIDNGQRLNQMLVLASTPDEKLSQFHRLPLSSEDPDCPQFGSSLLPYGNYKVSIEYNQLFERSNTIHYSTYQNLRRVRCDPILQNTAASLQSTDPFPPVNATFNYENYAKPLDISEIDEIVIYKGIHPSIYDLRDVGLEVCFPITVAFAGLCYLSAIALSEKKKEILAVSGSGLMVLVSFAILYEFSEDDAAIVFFSLTLGFSLLSLIPLWVVSWKFSRRGRQVEITEPSIAPVPQISLPSGEEADKVNDLLPRTQSKTCSENEGPVFKFFCPICMLYFKSLYKTSCCSNQVCLDCITSFIKSKGMMTNGDDTIPTQLPSAPCLHCMTEGFQLELLESENEGRNYHDSPNRPMPKADRPIPSPLRVGDSFEKMKKKMISFEDSNPQTRNKSATPSPASTTPRNADTSSNLSLPPSASAALSLPNEPIILAPHEHPPASNENTTPRNPTRALGPSFEEPVENQT